MMAEAISADAIIDGESRTYDSHSYRPSREKSKRLSTRVKNATLWGPRAVKRFVVKHKRAFAYIIGTLFILAVMAWWAWLILSFYAWLLMFNPVLFWLSIIVAVLSVSYLAYMFWWQWPRGQVHLSSETSQSDGPAAASRTATSSDATTKAPTTSRGAKPQEEADLVDHLEH